MQDSSYEVVKEPEKPSPRGWVALAKDYVFDPKNSLMFLLLLALIIVGTANRVMFKKMTNKMPNYPYFLSQFTTVVYVFIFWPVVWLMIAKTNRITKEQVNFPKWKFLIMGFLDGSSGLMMVFGGNNVAGPVQLLLIQAAIPMTMLVTLLIASGVFEFIRLRLPSKYRWNHYLGALTILFGVFVALYVKLFHHSGSSDSTQTTIVGVIIFLASTVPLAFSGVYKEIAFKGVDLDVYYFNAWVATFQVMWGVLFMPVSAIPGFGEIPISEVPSNLYNGMKCMVGINSVYHTSSQYQHIDDCHLAFLQVGGYTLANVTYNVLLLAVIKYGSAALFYIASAALLPLSDICFTLPFVMGSQTSKLTPFDIAGLIIILLGLFLYRLKGETTPDDEVPREVDSPESQRLIEAS